MDPEAEAVVAIDVCRTRRAAPAGVAGSVVRRFDRQATLRCPLVRGPRRGDAAVITIVAPSSGSKRSRPLGVLMLPQRCVERRQPGNDGGGQDLTGTNFIIGAMMVTVNRRGVSRPVNVALSSATSLTVKIAIVSPVRDVGPTIADGSTTV